MSELKCKFLWQVDFKSSCQDVLWNSYSMLLIVLCNSVIYIMRGKPPENNDIFDSSKEYHTLAPSHKQLFFIFSSLSKFPHLSTFLTPCRKISINYAVINKLFCLEQFKLLWSTYNADFITDFSFRYVTFHNNLIFNLQSSLVKHVSDHLPLSTSVL